VESPRRWLGDGHPPPDRAGPRIPSGMPYSMPSRPSFPRRRVDRHCRVDPRPHGCPRQLDVVGEHYTHAQRLRRPTVHVRQPSAHRGRRYRSKPGRIHESVY
jgi:hypothetical protein